MFDGWGEFALSYGVFLATHAIPARPSVKASLVQFAGRRTYGFAYGAVSLLALIWLISAASRAPFVPIWPSAGWQAYAPFVLMLPACLLVAFALRRPNPYSFGGNGNEHFDPEHPGVVRVTRHPLLAAIGLWALGHGIANPDLAHVVLFGGFVVFAMAGAVAINRRRGALDLAGFASGHDPMSALEVMVRTAAGLTLYGVLIAVHPLVAGVPVWPYLASLR